MNPLACWAVLGLIDVAIHISIYSREGPSPKMQSFALAHGEGRLWALVVFCIFVTVLLGPIALAITAAGHFRRKEDDSV